MDNILEELQYPIYGTFAKLNIWRIFWCSKVGVGVQFCTFYPMQRLSFAVFRKIFQILKENVNALF